MTQSAINQTLPGDRNDLPDEGVRHAIGQARRGVLIVDHQNLVGLCKQHRFIDVDPMWALNLAQRITNCERAILVTDLAVNSPISGNNYLSEAEIWSGYGYKIVHVPAKTQQIFDEKGNESVRRKDMTDHGLREELETWRAVPGITDILMLTHDVDSSKDLQKAAWAYGKRIILLTVGVDGVSYQLKQMADERHSILGYPAAYSFSDLERRGFWNLKRDAQDLAEDMRTIFQAEDGVRRYAFLRRQLLDAQHIFRYLYLDKHLLGPGTVPEANQLSWRLLRNTLHDLLRDSKKAAKLMPGSAPPTSISNINVLDAHEHELAPAQIKACQQSLDDIIRIMTETGLLMHTAQQRDGSSTITKHFYLNLDHPAVKVLLTTEFF